MADEESTLLKLNIKTTRQKLSVEIAADATVKEVGGRGGGRRGDSELRTCFYACPSPFSPGQLKELLCARMTDTPVAQQCLIFAGKILKDEESLERQGEQPGQAEGQGGEGRGGEAGGEGVMAPPSRSGVKDGVTVHLVVRSAAAAKVNTLPPPSPPPSRPMATDSLSASAAGGLRHPPALLHPPSQLRCSLRHIPGSHCGSTTWGLFGGGVTGGRG